MCVHLREPCPSYMKVSVKREFQLYCQCKHLVLNDFYEIISF